MSSQFQQRLLTVREYHRMAEAGILTADDRVELLNGQIICMSPIGSQHAACVDKLDELLKQLLTDQALVRVQNPVVLGEYSEPEPDIAVVRRKLDYYAAGHPTPEEVYLIIEVADSSLEKDRIKKRALYANAGIQHYWIINLDKKEIEVYHTPIRDNYRSRQLHRAGDTVAFPPLDLRLRAEDLLV